MLGEPIESTEALDASKSDQSTILWRRWHWANEINMIEMTEAELRQQFEVCEAYDKKLEAENQFLRMCLANLIKEYLRTPIESGSRDRLEDTLSRLEMESEKFEMANDL